MWQIKAELHRWRAGHKKELDVLNALRGDAYHAAVAKWKTDYQDDMHKLRKEWNKKKSK